MGGIQIWGEGGSKGFCERRKGFCEGIRQGLEKETVRDQGRTL